MLGASEGYMTFDGLVHKFELLKGIDRFKFCARSLNVNFYVKLQILLCKSFKIIEFHWIQIGL